MHSAQSQSADGLAHVIGATDEADHPFHFHGAAGLLVLGGLLLGYHQLASVPAAFCSLSFGGRPLISSTVLERVSATCGTSFKPSNAAKVALPTLCGMEAPSDLVSTFVIPATCITLRTGPPAMTPVPSEAGFSSTCAEPYRPKTWCGIVVPFRFSLIRFFFACSMPFLMAMGTSRALPMPNPAWPWLSPTTTSAEKPRFLPPLTTLVTGLRAMTSSFSSERLTLRFRRTDKLSRNSCLDI